MNLTMRPARWPADEHGLANLSTDYVTDRIYRLHREPFAFWLREEVLAASRHRGFPSLATELPKIRGAEHVVVAAAAGTILGIVVANLEAWNRRVRVEELHVAPLARRQGIGRALMDTVVAFARARGARCVWLETQAENHPAIQFYLRYGFRLCGLDERLYDPAAAGAADLAVFFAFDLEARTGA
jgi:ribosomal protein S18 acetylase RimI-like enzyme